MSHLSFPSKEKSSENLTEAPPPPSPSPSSTPSNTKMDNADQETTMVNPEEPPRKSKSRSVSISIAEHDLKLRSSAVNGPFNGEGDGQQLRLNDVLASSKEKEAGGNYNKEITSTEEKGRLGEIFGGLRNRFHPSDNVVDDSDEFRPLEYFDTNTEENSPVEVVRVTVSTNDNPSLPCLTFRFWVLATISSMIGAALTTFYYYRSNSLVYSVTLVQLVTYPLGKFMAWALPKKVLIVKGVELTLNPGPFNMKEHVLIGIAAITASVWAYGIAVISVQKLFYSQEIGFVGGLLFLVSSQCMGYGMAGFLRSFLVTPSQMVWPTTLVSAALYNTLHEHKPHFSRRLTRLEFFLMIFGLMFVYEFLPGFIAPVLSSLALLCWVNQKNNVLFQLGSGYSGLGIMDISLDWSYINVVNPMFTPWWAQLNFFVGIFLMLWIVTPIIYFTNLWGAKNYGIVSTQLYDDQGNLYNISQILNSDNTVNYTKYDEYSPVVIPTYFAMTTGTNFIAISSAISYVFLFHGKEIWTIFKDQLRKHWRTSGSTFSNAEVINSDSSTLTGPLSPTVLINSNGELPKRDKAYLYRDIHSRLISAYPRVPYLWYGIVFATCFVTGLIVCWVWLTDLPWWGFTLCIVIACVVVLPVGVLQAVANTQISVSVLMQFIAGYILPGHVIANVAFKVYGYMAVFQCIQLLQNLKLGQYMKIPPKKLFIVQIYATVLGCTINLIVARAILETKTNELIENMNEQSQILEWSAASSRLFFSSSVLWGAVGPARIYGTGSLYQPLLWCWMIGFMLPFGLYFLYRRYRRDSWIPWHLINVSIIAAGASFVPETSANFVISGLVVSWLTQYYLYRYKHEWWKKYNYVLSAALDAGTQISAMALFFVTNGVFTYLQFPQWIGNDYSNPEHCSGPDS